MHDSGSNHLKPRLLILDDDPLIGQTIQQIAEAQGFTSQYVITARDFFDELAGWQPDIVALDLIMPDMDGVEVISALGRMATSVPIILISGVGNRVLDAAHRSAQAHGLNILAVLPKPFNAATLRELLAQAITADSSEPAPDSLQASAAAMPTLPTPTLTDLQTALNQRQLSLVYQPKINCKTGALVGFEALCRWRHPTLGMISPDIFIPLAEQHNLIDELTLQVMETALNWLASVSGDGEIHKKGGYALKQATLSINISAQSLGNTHLFDGVVNRCRSYQLNPERVILEITETAAMQETPEVLDNLTRLRLQGFQLSLDDFGTGYSSMVQLVKLPFSEIKVDKSFVIDAAVSEESRAVVRSVVELGHSLGLKTTAEGVESEAALAMLKQLQCSYAQGYAIAYPLPAEAVIPWVLACNKKLEQARQTALQALQLLDTPPEERFDRLTRLACRLFAVKGVAVVLIDSDRLWVKSKAGFDVDAVPRDTGFCDATLEREQTFVLTDAKLNPDFCQHPRVVGPPWIRFYAGHGLVLDSGETIGLLCLYDNEPRVWSERDNRQLQALANALEQQLVMPNINRQDPVSGGADKDSYNLQATNLLYLSQKLELPVTIIGVKLHNLVAVNDSYGRVAGDELLKVIADCLQQHIPDADLLGRRRSNELAAITVDAPWDEVATLCDDIERQFTIWNKSRADDQAKLYCEIATTQIMPTADNPIEQVLQAEWNSRAIVQPQ